MPRKLARQRPSKKIGQKILIACEGSKTEPGYFESIRRELRLTTLQIILVPHRGKTDPRSVVDTAIEKRQEMRREKSWTQGDKAWAIFDGDEHIEQNYENWKGAIDRAKSQDVHLAITNPCFEFWYLIHFRDHFSQINRDRVVTLLKDHIPDYEKSICLYPRPLKDLTTQAIQRAERIAEQIQRDALDEYSNPCCSKLPDLVQSLLNLKSI